MNANSQAPCLAMIGCSGHTAQPFITQFLAENIQLRLLTRNPAQIPYSNQHLEIIQGSMMQVDHVAAAMKNADAAFLITPIGLHNTLETERQAAATCIKAAQIANLPHLIYVSVIQIDEPTGVPLLDSKKMVETMLAESGIPWTSLRAGSYMDDVIDTRLPIMQRGLWPFPMPVDHKLSLTAQQDMARVAAQLLRNKQPLNTSLDVIEPVLRTPNEIANSISNTLERKVIASGSRWLLPLLLLARPFLRKLNPRMATIVPLCKYFANHNYSGNPKQLANILPNFKVTPLEEHLQNLLS